MSFTRTDPSIPEEFCDLPADVLTEARELFEQCFVTASWDGYRNWGHTSDFARRLSNDPAFRESIRDREEAAVVLTCGRQGRFMRGATEYQEFGIPAALVAVARSVMDARAAA